MIDVGTGARALRRRALPSLAFRLALGLLSTASVGGGVLMGCLDRPIGRIDPRRTSTTVSVIGESQVDKIDLLLVIDNSGSMADKQDILASAVPQLVRRLVTPICVDNETDVPAEPPESSDSRGECPAGFHPEFTPIRDINVGIISSSLGAVGSQTCATAISPDDKAHLLARTDPKDPSSAAQTHEGRGFLAWDPDKKRPCLDDPDETCAGLSEADELIETLTTMVHGVGENGCGYEAPLEAAYRFLVDPAPWKSVSKTGDEVSKDGIDEDILTQRKAFLRPDSLLAVIALTDENDCSFRIDNLGGFAADRDKAMPRARRECEDDPGGACCVSCWDLPPEGCEGDGGCAEPGSQANRANYYPDPNVTTERSDGVLVLGDSGADLRCWDQKRRFGIDFLYPTERYINAFSKKDIDPARNDLLAEEGDESSVRNPLFYDEASERERPQNQVFFAGIVGAPWQLIARKDESQVPSLEIGLDADGKAVGGFQTYDELEKSKAWDLLLGREEEGQPKSKPGSTLMIESADERATTDEEKKINGGEWDTRYADLQYACIFELETPCIPPEGDDAPECTDCGADSVDGNDNPLCDAENPRIQTHAKAYPGTRVIEVLRGLEAQGVTASICPDLQKDVSAKNYGYTPAVFAIIDRLKDALRGSCQARPLAVDGDGDAPCVVIEAMDSDGDKDPSTTGACADVCSKGGRAPIGDRTAVAAEVVLETLAGEDTPEAASFDCLCEVTQLAGKPTDDDWETSGRYLCQNETYPPSGVDGWCYVDATTTPPLGNPNLPEIQKCSPTEKRVVRTVGKGKVISGGRQYITCAGDAAESEDAAPR